MGAVTNPLEEPRSRRNVHPLRNSPEKGSLRHRMAYGEHQPVSANRGDQGLPRHWHRDNRGFPHPDPGVGRHRHSRGTHLPLLLPQL